MSGSFSQVRATLLGPSQAVLGQSWTSEIDSRYSERVSSAFARRSIVFVLIRCRREREKVPRVRPSATSPLPRRSELNRSSELIDTTLLHPFRYLDPVIGPQIWSNEFSSAHSPLRPTPHPSSIGKVERGSLRRVWHRHT